LKKILIILIQLLIALFAAKAQENSDPDFQWASASYYNLNEGESFFYDNTEIKLIQVKNHYNLIKIGNDSVWTKVSRRSLPELLGGLRIFVADNKNVKALTEDSETHSLLKKDALICVSLNGQPLLDPNLFVFPVSFNDGFVWDTESDKYLFSYLGLQECFGNTLYRSHPGIDFELNDAKGIEKHWLLALENSTVVWIDENKNEDEKHQVSVLLESSSSPGIYYYYSNLYDRTLEVRKGQNLQAGELIGTPWGDNKRCFVHFAVIKSDSIPANNPESFAVVNFFPQFYDLYFQSTFQISKTFVKGTIFFGRDSDKNGMEKNNLAFEEYSGKGWLIGRWNSTDKVPSVSKGDLGNARLTKVLFAGTKAQCRNPGNNYIFEINVRNGSYRIRAKLGDVAMPTWQNILFENVNAGTPETGAGEFKWTSERIVKVIDGKLTIKINLNENESIPAGISEIVFQRIN